jgi:LacI family transcriptional regulator
MAETVTIRGVAADAGVSPATVSRVMNGVSSVAPDLADKVLRSVERLGYRPNLTARGLVSGRTSLVGVIVPDLSNPFFHAILKVLTDAAGEDDVSTVVVDANESSERELALAKRLLTQTDGLVLCSTRLDSAELRLLASRGQPMVCINRILVGMSVPSFAFDEYKSSLTLAAHLLSRGHRRIAYLEGPDSSWSNAERRRAILDAKSFGLEEVICLPCGSDPPAGFGAVASLLELDVTAVVAFNDYVALGVLAGLREHGIDVPQDMSLAAFDDIPLATYVSPGITSIHRPVETLARAAWQAFAGLLEGRDSPALPPLPGELITRASVTSPRAR